MINYNVMGIRKLLLHSCCGPCSTAVIERLLEDGGYSVSVFYYNPNITDEENETLRALLQHFLDYGFIPKHYWDLLKSLLDKSR